jgi:hypothetical protein
MKRRLYPALAVLAAAAFAAGVASTARAADPYAVDIQQCDRSGGETTVPAGVAVSVQNFAFVTGTQGLMQDFLLKQMTSKGVVRDGVLTIVDVSDQWSEPQQLGTSPARGWITHLPDTELDPLAPGEVVLVGSLTEFTGPIQIVFPPVGLVNFGPFHIPAGNTFFEGCQITAE